MKIRQFQLDDYSQVIALWQATGLEVGRSDSLPALRHKLEFDADLLLVAEEGGRIVGVVMGGYDGRRGWIYHLAVAPERQRTGLGRSLMDRVEKRFKTKGCAKINLLIEPRNARVQGFYERLGYTRDDLIFMEKWINQ